MQIFVCINILWEYFWEDFFKKSLDISFIFCYFVPKNNSPFYIKQLQLYEKNDYDTSCSHDTHAVELSHNWNGNSTYRQFKQ